MLREGVQLSRISEPEDLVAAVPGVVYRATPLRAGPFEASLTTFGLGGGVALQTGRCAPFLAFAQAASGERRHAAAAGGRRNPRAQRPAVPVADGGALRRRRRVPPGQPAGHHLRGPVLAHGPGRGAALPAARLAAAPPGGAGPARGRARSLGAGRRHRPCRGRRPPRRRRRPSTRSRRARRCAHSLLDAARGLVRDPEGRDGRSRRDAPARRRVVAGGRRVPARPPGAPDLHRGAVRGARRLPHHPGRGVPRHLRRQPAPLPEAPPPGHGARTCCARGKARRRW